MKKREIRYLRDEKRVLHVKSEGSAHGRSVLREKDGGLMVRFYHEPEWGKANCPQEPWIYAAQGIGAIRSAAAAYE